MSKPLGPIDVCCDAPPYAVVRMSRDAGVRSPEDVRWVRVNAPRGEPRDQTRGLLGYLRELLRGAPCNVGGACTCGESLPDLSVVVASLDEGEEPAYVLGQCPRCGTVFWDAT